MIFIIYFQNYFYLLKYRKMESLIIKTINKNLYKNNIKLPIANDLYIRNNYPNIYEFIINYFSDSESFKESLYRIKYNIVIRPTCLNCGGKVKFDGKLSHEQYCQYGFKKYCSPKCAANSEKQKMNKIESYKKNWGTDHPLKSKKFKEQTKKKYGTEYRCCSNEFKEKRKQTLIERYGSYKISEIPEILEKQRQGNIRRFGVDHPMKLQEFQNNLKTKNKEWWNSLTIEYKEIIKKRQETTNLEKFGNNCFFNSYYYKSKYEQIEENRKNTCLFKYGSNYFQTSDRYKENVDLYNKNRIKTCLKNFGTEYFTQSEFYKNNLLEYNRKKYETMKRNNSFNKSKSEDKLYQIFCKEFGDDNILRQYRSEHYPFNCDFYIKDLDLYIEYNGNWTHGKHPFDETNPDDLKTLQLWKDKSMEVNFKGEQKKYYLGAINVWTNLDVRKRNKAKENNLRFIEIWDLKNINEIIKKIKEG